MACGGKSTLGSIGSFQLLSLDPENGTIMIRYAGRAPMRRIMAVVADIADPIKEIERPVRGVVTNTFGLIVTDGSTDESVMQETYELFVEDFVDLLERDGKLNDELIRTTSTTESAFAVHSDVGELNGR